ncbi:diguanylate cyclase [Thiorhodococcus mannitoliphagus]|uniref:Diguanylate cyclase n=1 Tax=Thiorhodococcus mannitoliphagus TaxID=329406 RepID=A0A6P1E5Q2_9GAMM|nr:sensor domain-containing diguanylate cyclase [Thiorhodococcus mannitoliphagus]NEX22905.1 diguanylate cyclase [Thiorhodococcus mannitoliphagus]
MCSDISAPGQATQTSLKSLEALVEAIPCVLYQFRVHADGAWQFCYLSAVVETLFEISVEEAYADHNALTRCILPEDRSAHRASIRQATRNLTLWDHEHRIRTPSGRIKWVRGRAVPRPEPDGGVLWSGTLTDITQHKEKVQQLHRSEARYSAIVEGQTDLVCRFLPDRTLTFVNQAYCDYFGQGRDVLLSQDFIGLVPEGEHPFVGAKIAECNAQHPINIYEHRVRRADGEVRWVQWTDQAILDERGLLVELQSVGRDVTVQRQTEAALRASETRFRQLFNAMDTGFALHELILDDRGQPFDYRFVGVNPAFERLTGLSASAVIGRTIREVLPDIEPVWIETYAQVAMTGMPSNFEHYTKTLDKTFGVHAYCPQVGQFACLFADISERKRLEASLVELATKDDLTGLANRRHFMSRLAEELARLKRHDGHQAALLMLDLDHFKQINDTFGHSQGDVVLRQCATLMRTVLRINDQIGRIGGEEFVILLPDTDPAAARIFAERLRATIEQTPVEQPKGPAIRVTISIGVAELRSQDTSIDDALTRADAALYQAKNSGRNRVSVAQG